MLFNKTPVYTLLTFFLLMSCAAQSPSEPSSSSKENTLTPNALHLDCYIRYIENGNSLKVVAKIGRVTDSLTLQPIQLQKLPTFQGLTMAYNPRLQQYELKHKKAFEEKTVIEITKDNGETIQQTFKFPIISNPRIENDMIYKSKGFTINWDGVAQANGEDLFITLYNGKEKPLQMNWIGETKDNSIFVRKIQIEKLAIGSGAIAFVKKKYSKLDKVKGMSGVVAIEYYYTKIKIK